MQLQPGLLEAVQKGLHPLGAQAHPARLYPFQLNAVHGFAPPFEWL